MQDIIKKVSAKDERHIFFTPRYRYSFDKSLLKKYISRQGNGKLSEADIETMSNMAMYFSINTFYYIFNSRLVTPTTEMETERFLVQKCRISSESSFVRTFRSKFLGLGRTFSSCCYPRIPGGVRQME